MSSAGLGTPIVRIEGVEASPDAHLVVRPHAVVTPPEPTGLEAVGGDVTADAALAAGHADDDLVAYHQRHAGNRFPSRDARVLGLPDLFSGLRIEREHLSVEGGEEDPAVVVGQAAGLRARSRRSSVSSPGRGSRAGTPT